MAETLAQEQRRTKPKFEDIIASRASMDDEAKQVAFAFLDYCNAKNITYRWSSTNRWNLNAKSKALGYICIGVRSRDDDSWSIMLDLRELLQYEDFIQKENLTEIIYSNIHYCEKCNQAMCGKSEENPKITEVLGREFRNLCSVSASFKNPTAKALDDIRKILDFRLTFSHGTPNRPIFDSVTDGLTRVDNKRRVVRVSELQGSNLNFDCKYNGYFYVGPYESFMAKGGSNDVVFKLDEPVELKMYSLITGLRLDVPDSWTLYGAESKDGPWMLLDARDNFPKPVTLHTEKAFTIAAPKACQYYRITLAGWYFVLSQVHLYI